MKAEIMRMALKTGVFAFMLSSCSQSNEVINNNNNTNLENRNALAVQIDTTYKITNRDTSKEYSNYSKSINVRFDRNAENLTRMKKDFQAENSIQRMKYDQEIFDLNKKNVQIKSKANRSANHNLKTWDYFKTSTNVEMYELEKSIQALSERKL